MYGQYGTQDFKTRGHAKRELKVKGSLVWALRFERICVRGIRVLWLSGLRPRDVQKVVRSGRR